MIRDSDDMKEYDRQMVSERERDGEFCGKIEIQLNDIHSHLIVWNSSHSLLRAL